MNSKFEEYIKEKYSKIWIEGFNDGADENLYPRRDMPGDYYNGYIEGYKYRVLGK